MNFTLAILSDVEGTLFDFVFCIGGYAEGGIKAGVEVFNPDGVLDRLARTLRGGFAIDGAFLKAAAEGQDADGVGEVAVHAVVLGVGHDVWDGDLVFDFEAGLALGHHVAAELGGDNDEGFFEEAALFKVANEPGYGGVDGPLHVDDAGVAVFVSVPEAEGDVLGGDFNEPGTGFDEATGEEAAEAEAGGVVSAI